MTKMSARSKCDDETKQKNYLFIYLVVDVVAKMIKLTDERSHASRDAELAARLTDKHRTISKTTGKQ